jgi:hypothetical protein
MPTQEYPPKVRRPGKPSAIHERIIGALRDEFPNAERHQFGTRLRAAVEEWGNDEDPFHRRPDAFVIDVEQREVTVFEVEITGYLTQQRLREWAMLWMTLDGMEWDLHLIRVDRIGDRTKANLGAYYYSFLAEDAAA